MIEQEEITQIFLFDIISTIFSNNLENVKILIVNEDSNEIKIPVLTTDINL